MKTIDIPLKLYNEIEEYCLYNNIEDIQREIVVFLKRGFNLDKYGETPFKTPSKVKNNDDDKTFEKNVKQEIKVKKGINIVKKE